MASLSLQMEENQILAQETLTQSAKIPFKHVSLRSRQEKNVAEEGALTYITLILDSRH